MAPLTFIAGGCGMDFKLMPEPRWSWAYPWSCCSCWAWR
ncbi:CorA family divalent cation transporter [Desulfonatronum sp. SC1]|nr:hypothetical protein C6366_16590 [Desulfonatronum sp. SC1]